MIRLPHGRREVALHPLGDADGPPLLCLHELEADAGQWRAVADVWPGRAVGLDFAGHGASSWLDGGGYVPELFAADADVALAALSADGPVTVVGAGIGAYVALLLAGARPDHVVAAGLLDGRGLDGGGAEPGPAAERPARRDEWLDLVDRSADPARATDPLVELCLTDLRPPDYAAMFAAEARVLLLGEDETGRPPWWVEVRGCEAASPGPAEPVAMVEALARRV